MTIKLVKVIFYTFCLLRWPANLSTIGHRLFGGSSTTDVDEEDGGINPRDGRASSKTEKHRMFRSTTNESTNAFITNPEVFDWVEDNYNITDDDFDFIFEDKKREDAYKRTTAENSPHSILLGMLHNEQSGTTINYCTGSLVTRSMILTAAHCLIKRNTNKIVLFAGGNSAEELKNALSASDHVRPAGTQLQVGTEFYIHPEYKPNSSYDVAVVKSKREFNLTKTVNIINISDEPWRFKGYKDCTFTGFGSVKLDESHNDDYTRKTQELKIESPCRCDSYLDKLFKAGTYLCSKPMEDYGLCRGDSGGALMCDGKMMGISMSGAGMTNAETCEMDDKANLECGSKNTISIFQDSYLVRDWLKSILTSVDQSETTTITDRQIPGTPMASHSQTLTTPADSHGSNIKLASGLLTLSMIINILKLTYKRLLYK